MKILKFSFLSILTITLIYSCNKFDDNDVPCPKVDSVYYRLDSMDTSLMTIYHVGDTLKLKDSTTGVIYYFIAQNPNSGYKYQKDPESIYTNCPGDDWFMGYYKIQLNNSNSGIGPIIIRAYYSSNSYSKFFEIEFQQYTYWSSCWAFPTPPSTEYIDSVIVDKHLYRYVQKMRVNGDSPLNSFAYYNRNDGLIRIISPSGVVYEKVP